jgi:prepilin peptidase CpaA
MNLIIGAPVWLVALLALALAAGAVEDAVRLRISNLTCVAVFLTGIVAMAFYGFPLALWHNLVVFLAILVLGTFAFSAGWLGGGDVKLLAALGLWFDFRGALLLIGATFLAGGVLAALYLLARPLRRSRGSEANRRIPYGLAIAAGALVAFGMQGTGPAPNPYITKLQVAQRR